MDLESILVTIRDAQGERHRGLIGDLLFGGEGVEIVLNFPPMEGPPLPLGRAAQAEFSGGPFPAVVQAAGLVVSRVDGEEVDSYRLRFGNAAYPVLGVLFESRRAARVEPVHGTAITVALRSLDGPARPLACELENISVDGLALSVPLLHESQLAGSQRVRMGFSLPGSSKPMVVDGTIRHRNLSDGKLVYGIRFDSCEGEDNQRKQCLEAFIDERMTEVRDKGSAAKRQRKETP